MENELYTANLIVRMTENEKKNLALAASKKGVSISKFVRDSVVNPPSVTRAEYDEIKSMINYEIRKLGVNINQIAKKYNEYAYVEPSLDLLDKMNRIVGLMYEINERIKE